MHTYIWKCTDFLAVAQAPDQFEARKILLQEFSDEGAPKEFSERVQQTSPEIFHRAVAEFVRTESYELQQADAEVERLKQTPSALAARMEEEREEWRRLLTVVISAAQGWCSEFNKYRGAWLREMGGEIRRKTHEIDGFVLRTRDIYEGYKQVPELKKRIAELEAALSAERAKSAPQGDPAPRL
jgi:hypothetical protein